MSLFSILIDYPAYWWSMHCPSYHIMYASCCVMKILVFHCAKQDATVTTPSGQQYQGKKFKGNVSCLCILAHRHEYIRTQVFTLFSMYCTS